MQVYHPNNVKIYSVTSASRSAIPDWVAKKSARALKSDQGNNASILTKDYTRRIDLVQDFDFPEASNRVRMSPDGKYILATGKFTMLMIKGSISLDFESMKHLNCR